MSVKNVPAIIELSLWIYEFALETEKIGIFQVVFIGLFITYMGT